MQPDSIGGSSLHVIHGQGGFITLIFHRLKLPSGYLIPPSLSSLSFPRPLSRHPPRLIFKSKAFPPLHLSSNVIRFLRWIYW